MRRIASNQERDKDAPDVLHRRMPRLAWIALALVVFLAALFAVPSARNMARQALNSIRQRFRSEERPPALQDRPSSTPGNISEEQLRPHGSEENEVQGLSPQPLKPTGSSSLAPRREQKPAYLPLDNARLQQFNPDREQGTEYVLSGKVTSEQGEVLPGATVSLHYSRMKSPKFELQAPILVRVCDDHGLYSIRLNTPMRLCYVTVDMKGYGRMYEEISFLDPGVVVKNYRLPRAGCVEGFVFDMDGRPISGAEVYFTGQRDANLPFGSTLDSARIVGITGPSGNYSLQGVPEGAVRVWARSSQHLKSSKPVSVKSWDCAHLDFRLTVARTFSFAVKNRDGDILPDAAAYTSKEGFIHGNEPGEMEISLPPGTNPFKCWVTAEGYKTISFLLDPKFPPAVVVLEKGELFSGRVISESGESIANATVILQGGEIPGQFVFTNESGRFSVILSATPLKSISAYRKHYSEQQLAFNPKNPAPPEIEIVLKKSEGGIFGRVIDDSGIPVKRFEMFFSAPSAKGNARYSVASARNSENDSGMFYVDDVPAGTYNLIIRSLPFSQGSYQELCSEMLLEQVEIRKGCFFGEIVVQFPPPRIRK